MVGFLHPNVFDDASESLRLGRGAKVGKRSILGRPSSKFRHNSNRWRLIGQCSTKVAIGDPQWPASHFKRGCIDVSHVTVRSAIFNRLRKKIALIEETENILLLAFVLTSHFPFLLQLYLVVDYMRGVPDAAWTIARQTTFCSPTVFLSDATLKSAKTSRVMEQTFTRK